MKSLNRNKKNSRKNRVSSRIDSRSNLPRLVVKRSLNHLHAQVIGLDGKVISAASTLQIKDLKGTKVEAAAIIGTTLGEATKKAKVTAVVLDRGQYRFHGRIRAMVENLNKTGVKC